MKKCSRVIHRKFKGVRAAGSVGCTAHRRHRTGTVCVVGYFRINGAGTIQVALNAGQATQRSRDRPGHSAGLRSRKPPHQQCDIPHATAENPSHILSALDVGAKTGGALGVCREEGHVFPDLYLNQPDEQGLPNPTRARPMAVDSQNPAPEKHAQAAAKAKEATAGPGQEGQGPPPRRPRRSSWTSCGRRTSWI